ncbi:HEPN domain-containing protein [Hymenobacter nivis]|uniref:HEPN domain-containing protein n=1 Tax=Hymenobacter nivis TaxID=1850093 RepID=A0A2Z3GK01_9BACT|nr:HEPN domain-containing protein [Hymenobacter nivis]AWM31456.1 hypothetical protein DDQ68_00820 [Hymenobacter nivis]
MSETKKKLKAELADLLRYAEHLHNHEAILQGKIPKKEADILNTDTDFKKFQKEFDNISISYNKWYSKTIQIINQLLPDRIIEFKKLYNDEKRTKDITFLNYSISDYLIGLRITRGWEKENAVDAFAAFHAKILQQISILNSCLDIIDSKLSNIEGILQSELFASELDMAKDMLKKKHIRVSGALAGITLEIHLKKVCINHGVVFKKAHPTITDFNEELRKSELIDVPTWRLIQRLGDIRNLSVHSKDREPTADEVEDLIRGCEKLIAELY